MAVENVKSINRALQILECISKMNGGITLHELYKQTSIPKSTLKRIIETLITWDYLKQDYQTSSYELGIKFLVFAGVVQQNINLRNLAFPIMKALSKELRETVNLNIVEKGERVCIEVVEPETDIRHFVSIGHRSELYRGSTGKILLAHLSEKEVEKAILKAVEDKRIDANQLREELKEIKQTGYAVTEGERIIESFAVSAPIFDHKNEMAAGLTVSGPIHRFTKERKPDVIAGVVVAARNISNKLGFVNQLLIEEEVL
jgi:IclR family transcriptional regulator, KDG regulon repressor